MPLIKTIANFDDIRKKEFRRFPVERSCSRCHRKFVVARIFGESKGRFILHRCSEFGIRLNGGPCHLVRDRLAYRIARETFWRLIERRVPGPTRIRKDLEWRAWFLAEQADLHLDDAEASNG